jgi:hypothetical protein
VSHYVNGQLVSEKAPKIRSPFRIGKPSWGTGGRGFPDNDPAMIRNSAARWMNLPVQPALPLSEIRALYSSDKPQPVSGGALTKKSTCN